MVTRGFASLLSGCGPGGEAASTTGRRHHYGIFHRRKSITRPSRIPPTPVAVRFVAFAQQLLQKLREFELQLRRYRGIVRARDV